MREDSVQRCLKSCEAARLVVLYSIEGKEYLEVTNFRQQVRSKKSKYPAPDAHMRSTCLADAQHMHTKTESETKTNNTPSTPSVHRGRSRRPSSGRGPCGACAFNPRPDTGLRHSLLGKPGCRQLTRNGIPVTKWQSDAISFATSYAVNHPPPPGNGDKDPYSNLEEL